ncbi:MAG: SDR family NAD(P)-dependent oxidoreductase [Alphaproteobacteria bacterium]
MKAIKYKKYGPWALVTGASSGIGEEFARQLAANGLNVVLVARRKQALDNIARELESKYDIKAKTVAVDLSQPEAIDVIDEATKEMEVGLLVNNAAMILAGALVKTEVTDQMQVFQVNIVAPLQLAHLFGRKMSQRGQGGIIFVASVGGYTSMPYMANYMGTKAYLISLGEALHYELKGKGVDVTVLCPGGTKTGAEFRVKGLDGSLLSGNGMSVTPVVTNALKALGQKPAVIPGLMNNVMVLILTKFLPRKVVRNIFVKMIKKAVLKEYL